MLTWEMLVEAQALRAQGWSISAIARHLDVTRLTVRRYLSGERVPGQRARTMVDPFEEVAEYCRLRLAADPHLWASTLFDEVVELGYAASYQSFTRALRTRELRPRCAVCAGAKAESRDRQLIDHPAGAESQWDWLELPDPPERWGLDGPAHLLLGTLAHSSRWRGAAALDRGAAPGRHSAGRADPQLALRSDGHRLPPGSGRITASFGPVAMHYAVELSICPSRRAWRKGAVEKSAHTIAQRWWRTLPDDVTATAAQASLDRLCIKLDGRRRMRDGVRTTVGELADAEPLRPLPAPFPAVIDVERTISNQALVAFRGNTYSVPPGHVGQQVAVRHKLGTTILDIRTSAGLVLAHHRREPDGAGMIVRLDEHVTALTKVVLADFTDRAPCRRKTRRPPDQQALAEADRIRRGRAGIVGEQVVVDFTAYAEQTRPLHGSVADEQAGQR
jgi:transcriptional regulator with XRE-family HTH domain